MGGDAARPFTIGEALADVRHCRVRRIQTRCCRCSSRACAGSSTAATTRRASRSSGTARCTCGGAPASCRSSRRCSSATRSRASSASATRGGRRTAGRPTENAHPHRDCRGRIVVVHNGIIENYLELKRELIAEGHKFVTDTDTEIVAHLVEKESRGDGLAAAVRRALKQPARPLRARADLGRRPRHDRHGAQRAARGRRARQGRVLRRVGHPRDPRAHARRRVPRRSRDRRRHQGGRGVHGLRRPADPEDAAARHVGSGHGGEGGLPALHAQGDLRAAARPSGKPCSAACRPRRARSTSRK